MIGPVVVMRHDQDWTGFFTVVGILLVLAVLAYVNAWWNDRRVERFDTELDHETCANDGCDVVLCYCRTGLRCPDAEEPGCPHHGFLCGEHRLDCMDCRIDARDDAGVAW